jgi:FkbM family methyltransferase
MQLDHENIVKKIIKTFPLGGTYVDCGAHQGLHTKSMLSRFDVESVWAFEPIPFLFEQHLKKIQDPRLLLFNCAVGQKIGHVEFHVHNKHPGYSGIKKRSQENLTIKIDLFDDWSTINTTITTLDIIWLNSNKKNIDLIKIDVEGAEFEVMVGAEKILQYSRPMIIFENGLSKTAMLYNYNYNDFFQFFNSIDYTLKDFYGKTVDIDYWIDFEKTLHTYMFVAIPNEKKLIADYYDTLIKNEHNT